MNIDACITITGYSLPLLCLIALISMRSQAQVSRYKFLALYLVFRLVSETAMLSLIHLGPGRISEASAYPIYFTIYWGSYGIEAALGLAIIYDVYRLAMDPLRGLQHLGTLMFRWAAGIAVAISLAIGIGPHVTGTSFLLRAISQLQQTVSVLTLCMLLFVCIAIKPMGLSHRSRIFGVSLGLGVMACADLVTSAWVAMGFTMRAQGEIALGLASCLAATIWVGYFTLPEPKRQLIILPTTSPFLRWNQISLALGDQPGFVAIGEVGIDMFAPAEVEVMRRASLKMGNALTN